MTSVRGAWAATMIVVSFRLAAREHELRPVALREDCSGVTRPCPSKEVFVAKRPAAQLRIGKLIFGDERRKTSAYR
jgi:hypothetical protein